MPGVTITIHLTNDEGNSLRIATVANWNGKAFVAPRAEFKQLLARDEIKRAGIYFLLGRDVATNEPRAYIGEADSVRKRLPNHNDKEFWNEVIVIVSSDSSLHKGHVKYLEGRLLEEAKKAGRYKVTNDQNSAASLPEFERENMEGFLSKVRLLLPVLNCDLITPLVKGAHRGAGPKLAGEVKGLVASGQRTAKGFVVFAGSEATKDYRKSVAPYMVEGRNKLIADKKLIPVGGHYEFSQDCEFATPTAAAAVICGGHVNGLTFWKTKDGKELKELEKEL
jgi:hypothetical protein